MSTLLCYSFVLLCFLSFFFAVNGDENGLSEMRDACSVPASKQPTAKLPLELAFSLPLSLGHIGDIRDTVCCLIATQFCCLVFLFFGVSGGGGGGRPVQTKRQLAVGESARDPQ